MNICQKNEKGLPLITYTKNPLLLEYNTTTISEKESFENFKKLIPADYYYAKTKRLEFDDYSLYLMVMNNKRYFLKQYDKTNSKNIAQIVCNEFLYQYYKPIVSSPNLIYIADDSYVYRIAEDITPDFEIKNWDNPVIEIFNSPYNCSPIEVDFIEVNSILHYFHTGVLSPRNLIKYNGEYYIFDMWGNLLLEYVNFVLQVDYITDKERELLNLLKKNDIFKIRNLVISKLEKCFNINTIETILDDCEKAVSYVVDYLLNLKGEENGYGSIWTIS